MEGLLDEVVRGCRAVAMQYQRAVELVVQSEVQRFGNAQGEDLDSEE
jgi:hypothetical protein